MKKMNSIVILIVMMCLLLSSICYGANIEYEKVYRAIHETGEAYVRVAAYGQYDGYRNEGYSTPEQASEQHTIYSTCSYLVYRLYMQSFHLNENMITDNANYLKYAEINYNTTNNQISNGIGKYILQYYGTTDEIYSASVLGSTDASKHQYINKMAKILKVGDVLATKPYDNSTGHVMVVGEIIGPDSNGNYSIYLYESQGNQRNIEAKKENHEPNGTFAKTDLFSVVFKQRAKLGKMAWIRFIQEDNTYLSMTGNFSSPSQVKTGFLKDDYLTDVAKVRLQYPNLSVTKIAVLENQKTSSIVPNSYVAPGDSITYNIEIENCFSENGQDYENLTLVEKFDAQKVELDANALNDQNDTNVICSVEGNQIIWTIKSIPIDMKINLQYTVKVKNDLQHVGGRIVSEGMIDGSLATARLVHYIGEKLSQNQMDAIQTQFSSDANLAEAKNKYTGSEMEFISQIYHDLVDGMDISAFETIDLSRDFEWDKTTSYHQTIIKNELIQSCVVNNLYGKEINTDSEGFRNWDYWTSNSLKSQDEYLCRAKQMGKYYTTINASGNEDWLKVHVDNLEIGDIVVLYEDSMNKFYLYIGEDTFLRKTTNGEIEVISNSERTDLFTRNSSNASIHPNGLVYYTKAANFTSDLIFAEYAVLRPSLISKENNYRVEDNYYSTLSSASYAISGTKGEIIVEKSNICNFTLTIAQDKEIILNLNGKNITTKQIINNGTLTIMGEGNIINDSQDANALTPIIKNTGILNIENGIITNTGGMGIRNSGVGEIYLSGGSITGSTIGINVDANATGQIIISGGEITALNGAGIYHNGTGNILISGENTKITATGNAAIMNLRTATLSITGGIITSTTSNSAISNSSGTLIVGENDGSVSMTNPVIRGGIAINSPNGFEFYDGSLKGSIVAISGGTAKITQTVDDPNYKVLYSFETIEGKIYETAYLSKNINYSVTKNGQTKYFASLARAYTGVVGLDNATTSGVIEVLNNNFLDDSRFVVENGKDITVRLNGNTVIRNRYAMVNNGTLTLNTSGMIRSTVKDYNNLENLIQNTGTLTIDNITLENWGWNNAIEGWNTIYSTGGNISINNSIVRVSGIPGMASAAIVMLKDTKVEITNGTIENASTNGQAVISYSDEIISSNGELNLVSGTISSLEGEAIYFYSSSNNNCESIFLMNDGIVKTESSSSNVPTILVESNISDAPIIIIEKGEVTANAGSAIICKGCSINIGSGNVYPVTKKWPIIQGGKTDGVSGIDCSGTIYFYGGVVKGKECAIAGDGENISIDKKVDDNYDLIYDYDLDPDYESVYLDIIDSNNYNYQVIYRSQYYYCMTLSSALSKASLSPQCYITVLRDCTDSSNVTIRRGRIVNINTNGHELTKLESGIVNHGILNITGNGIIRTTSTVANNTTLTDLITNDGTLNITNATIFHYGKASGSWNTIQSTAGRININGGTIKVAGNLENDEVSRAIAMLGNTKVSIDKGGVIQNISTNGQAIASWSNNNIDSSGEVVISSGDVYSDSSMAIYFFGTEGQTCGSKITMDGGTVESRNTTEARSAILVSHSDSGSTNGAITIKGGTIKSNSGTALNILGSSEVIIGESGDIISTTSPIIQGKVNGVSAVNGFQFQGGIIKGGESAIKDNNSIITIPNGYEFVNGKAVIDDIEYQTVSLRKINSGIILKGDINHDGEIDIIDVRLLLQKVVNKSYTSDEIEITDINNDGEVDIIDVRLLLQQVINK